ncbi:MAG: hypothetical protein WAT39_18035 [Planctomycetota bacterium]
MHRATDPSLLLPCLIVLGHLPAQDATAALPVAGAPDVVFSATHDLVIVHVNTPGHPTNVVPGTGTPFRTGGTGTSAFERPWTSSDGSHLAINVVAGAPATTTDDDVLLLDGALLLREGSAAPWTATENVGTIDADFAINNSGHLLFGNNTSATTLDDYIVQWNGASWSVLAQEGGATPLGGTWSSSIDSLALSNPGGAYWRDAAIVGLPATSSAAVVLGGGGFLQEGVDIPLGQAGGATNTWENFTINRIYVSPNGASYLVLGDTNAATTGDLVLVLNNTVQIQEGQVLPGSTFATGVSAIGKAWIDRGGNWYARGSNATTGDDWLVRNGVLVADSAGASEVVPGSGEFWDDASFTTCFFCADGNALGQFVFGGVTTAPLVSNGVLVFDDGAGFRRVVARESDPIDLDGNGLFDDDRFFNTFGDDDVLLLDDGSIVFTATLKNGAGTAVDQGLFKLVPKAGSCTLRNGTGVNPLACTCASLPILGTTWNVAVAPSPNTALTLAFASAAPTPFPVPLFGGELLIDPLTAISLPGSLVHPVPLPPSQQFLGLLFFVQGIRIEVVGPALVIQLVNGQDAVIGL